MSGTLKAAKRAGRVATAGSGQVMGDPGHFGGHGIFGGLFGGVKGAIGSVLRGGSPIGGAISGFSGQFKKRGGVTMAPPPPGTGIALRPPMQPISGGSGGLSVSPAVTGAVLAVPRGMHLNKSDYFLRDGTYVAKGTRFVSNRRRNALNPRALRRAISRIDAGKTWQSKLSEITTAKFKASGQRKD